MYCSDRGIPLICQQVYNIPVITLENYCKWYNIYVIMPDGNVSKVDMDLIQCIQDKSPIHIMDTHIWHPIMLEKIASHLQGYVDDVSLECCYGRWMMEHKNVFPLDLV